MNLWPINFFSTSRDLSNQLWLVAFEIKTEKFCWMLRPTPVETCVKNSKQQSKNSKKNLVKSRCAKNCLFVHYINLTIKVENWKEQKNSSNRIKEAQFVKREQILFWTGLKLLNFWTKNFTAASEVRKEAAEASLNKDVINSTIF